MCDANTYGKDCAPMIDDAIIGGGIPMANTSSKEEIISLGQTIKSIDNCIQCFEVNYENRINSYKINTSELFKKSTNHFL